MIFDKSRTQEEIFVLEGYLKWYKECNLSIGK